MRRTPGSPHVLTLVIAALSLTVTLACTSATTSMSTHVSRSAPRPATNPATPTARSEPRASTPLVVIFMENHERAQIVGSPSAPFENALLRQGRDYTNYFAITHPSLPNYLAVASGTTSGMRSDDVTAGELSRTPTLWDQLTAAHIGWAVYEQSMPSACYGSYAAGSAPDDYALKHNPAIPFQSVYADRTECAQVQPLVSMRPAHLPAFSFITPNECNDAHSCTLDAGDRWLAHLVPRLVSAGADVVVTYDEGTSDLGAGGTDGGGRVYTVEVGHGVPAGSVVTQQLNHFSLLAGIEDRFGLRPLDEAASATAMRT
jgi:phosphatidylinositol-3-phosphatase